MAYGVMSCDVCLNAYIGNKKLFDRNQNFNIMNKSERKYIEYYMIDWCSACNDFNFNINIKNCGILLSDIQSDLIRNLEYNAHQHSKSIYNKKLFNKMKHCKK
jgi:hypothetical protein